MKNTEEIRKEIESLVKRQSSLDDEQHDISEKIRQLRLKLINLPFEGKYIKYTDTFDSTPMYMKVDWIRQAPEKTDRKRPYSYTFKGYGFWGEFTGYDDATNFDWSYWFEFNISGDYSEIKDKIAKIEVIDKKEFDEAFEKMIESIKEYHNKIK